jgi:hypothetical protein
LVRPERISSPMMRIAALGASAIYDLSRKTARYRKSRVLKTTP